MGNKPKDVLQLVQLLPAHFAQLHRAFHSNAGRLAGSAGQSDFIEIG